MVDLGQPRRDALGEEAHRVERLLVGMRPPTFIQTDSVEKPSASRSSSSRSVTASGVP